MRGASRIDPNTQNFVYIFLLRIIDCADWVAKSQPVDVMSVVPLFTVFLGFQNLVNIMNFKNCQKL